MDHKVDGWTLMARIAAQPLVFHACDTTATLAALLIVRSQLAQGVSSRDDIAELSAVVGVAAMREVIDNLAGYEALRVIDNIGDGEALGANRGAAAARRWLLECLEPKGNPSLEPGRRQREPEVFTAPPSATRALRNHRAMGARRLRSGG